MRTPRVNWRLGWPARSVGVRYGLALFACLVSFLLRDALSPWLHDRDYIVFVPAIILVSFFSDLGPAILAILLSSAAVWYFFTPPFGSFYLDLDSLVGIAAFAISGAVAMILVHLLRVSIRQVEAERAKATALATEREADLKRVILLNELGLRLVSDEGKLNERLNDILEAAIALSGANKGNIQLFDPNSGALRIAAQRGFEETFLEFFSDVRDASSTCGAAMQSKELVIVEDVTQSEIFAGKPTLSALLEAGVRAVISAPLISSTDHLLGMISTHFTVPHRPNERHSHFLASLTRQAAEYLERKRTQETERLLVREISHRSSNQLAVISAIARRCFSDNSSVVDALSAFEGRLSALAHANHELGNFGWRANLAGIVRSTLEPFSARTKVAGPDVMLDAQLAQGFSLAIHELATNAMKYGALSNPEGFVEIAWTVRLNDGKNVLAFCWQEHGGPPVVAPSRQGFGTTLLKMTFSDIRIDYAREGFNCEIELLVRSDNSDGAHAVDSVQTSGFAGANVQKCFTDNKKVDRQAISFQQAHVKRPPSTAT